MRHQSASLLKNYEAFSCREPGCLSRPTFSRWEPPGTCRSSSPPGSRSRGRREPLETMANTQHNRGTRGPLPTADIFFYNASPGRNRRLLTLSSGLLNGSVYLKPPRSDKNSRRLRNMKQPSAGQSVAPAGVYSRELRALF